MIDIKTDQSVLEALRRAARPLSPAERRRQRISLVMGLLPHDSRISKDEVQRIIDVHEGRAAGS